MGVGRAVDVVRGVQGLVAEGGGGVADQGHVVAQLRGRTAGALDAGVGRQADQDEVRRTLLLQPHIEVGARKAAGPVLGHDHVAGLRREVRMPLAAPAVLLEHQAARAGLDIGVGMGPGVEVARRIAVMRDDEHRDPGRAGGGDHRLHVVVQACRALGACHAPPELAVVGQEIVVRVDQQKGRAAFRKGKLTHTCLLKSFRAGFDRSSARASVES